MIFWLKYFRCEISKCSVALILFLCLLMVLVASCGCATKEPKRFVVTVRIPAEFSTDGKEVVLSFEEEDVYPNP